MSERLSEVRVQTTHLVLECEHCAGVIRSVEQLASYSRDGCCVNGSVLRALVAANGPVASRGRLSAGATRRAAKFQQPWTVCQGRCFKTIVFRPPQREPSSAMLG